MKILHVCDSIIGGTGSYLAELLPYQSERYGDGNVTLIMPSLHLEYVEEKISSSSVRIVTFYRSTRLVGLFCLFFVYLFHRIKLAPDIVHAHSFGAGLVTRVTSLFTMRKGKIVYCPHGWAFDIQVARWRTACVALLERALSLFSSRLILISDHERRRAEDIGIPKRKLSTVHSGISAHIPDVTPTVWEDHRLKLLFVGRFDRQKGLDILLEAIEPLGEKVTLRIIGSNVVSSDFDPRRFFPFVEYLGWLPREEIGAHMAASDFLVVPSRWEGFGLVALEAMRLSLPVIASRVGGLRETLDNGRYGICFEPGNALDLRRCIEAIEHRTMDQWRTLAHQRFLSSFTSDSMTSSIDTIYAELTRVGPREAMSPIKSGNATTPERADIDC